MSKSKKLSTALAIAVTLFSGHALAGKYIHFPALAKQVLAGDGIAFRKLLVMTETTPPGEKLEELAELSSRFVRIAPEAYLREQDNPAKCFGVSFMGVSYVDNPQAKAKERAARRKALESVNEPDLIQAKKQCLGKLAGS